MYIGVTLAGLVFALFLTLILGSSFYKRSIRPSWLLYLLIPLANVAALYVGGELYGMITLFFFFACIVILVIYGKAYKFFREKSKKIKFIINKETSFRKKIGALIAPLIIGALIVLLGVIQTFLIFVAVAILSSFISPSLRKRFFQLQDSLPTSKIRSMAMGLVEIEGNVIMKKTILSPIKKVACIGYEYTIEKVSKDEDGDKSYSTIFSDIQCNRFDIKDDTGQVEVNPEGIEFLMFPLSGRYEKNEKRYSEYILKEEDLVMIIGKASLENEIVIIQKETVKNIFAVTPTKFINFRNKYQSLFHSFVVFSSIVFLFIAAILFLPSEKFKPNDHQPVKKYNNVELVPVEDQKTYNDSTAVTTPFPNEEDSIN